MARTRSAVNGRFAPTANGSAGDTPLADSLERLLRRNGSSGHADESGGAALNRLKDAVPVGAEVVTTNGAVAHVRGAVRFRKADTREVMLLVNGMRRDNKYAEVLIAFRALKPGEGLRVATGGQSERVRNTILMALTKTHRGQYSTMVLSKQELLIVRKAAEE